MRAEWEVLRLGEACSISSTLVDPREVPYATMIHVGGANIESETGSLLELRTAQQEGLKSGKFVFDQSMVLYSKIRPYLKKVARPDFHGLCSADVYPLSPNPHRLDRGYLFYLLFTPEFTRFSIAGSARAGMPKVNREHLFAFEFRLPPLAVQQRIVSILDEAFEAIATARAHAEKNLQNARALLQAHLSDVFSTARAMVPLADLAEDITDGDHSPPPKSNSGVPFITISDIVKRTRTISFENTFFVPEEYYCALKPNKKPRVGDILYTVTGATLGIPVHVDQDVPFCFQRHIGLIRPKAGTHSRWLSYAMLSPQVFSQATQGATGAAQKTVSLKVLRRIVVPRVPLNEQVQIATTLRAIEGEIERLELIYQRKLAALDELKKCLLHRAFSGELTASEPTAVPISAATGNRVQATEAPPTQRKK